MALNGWVILGAGDMSELRRREKEMGIEPDYEVDAFMKAMSRDPKRESIATDYALHYLGLDVCLPLMQYLCQHVLR